MNNVKPYVETAVERINKLSNDQKVVGVVGVASLIVLTSYLTTSSRKVLLGCTNGAKLPFTESHHTNFPIFCQNLAPLVTEKTIDGKKTYLRV